MGLAGTPHGKAISALKNAVPAFPDVEANGKGNRDTGGSAADLQSQGLTHVLLGEAGTGRQ